MKIYQCRFIALPCSIFFRRIFFRRIILTIQAFVGTVGDKAGAG